MSMQSLNHLVARSIVDPSVMSAFAAGDIDPILCDLGFSAELRASLASLKAESWAEFAVLAYRAVQAAETPAVRFQLPSPLEGLRSSTDLIGREQVA
jgi:hypothetical protein